MNKLKTYTCGTLSYTKPKLMILFFWLLWGDFCYTLMEAVTPSIMPLRFKDLGASNVEVGLFLGTLPGIVYAMLNPIISFKSDRFRSRFGRRIPFILFSIPAIVLFLTCLGFGEKIGFWIHDHIGIVGSHLTPMRAAIITIGLFMVAFTFFNTFVTSVFWYLFNDVVPPHLVARFMSFFRLISMGAASLYNFVIFRHAGAHFEQILVGAALLYLVGFGAMCLMVKEGKYPPPPPLDRGKSGPWAAVKTYAKECCLLKHYWYLWVQSFIGSMGGGIGMFGLYFSLALGLNLTQIGMINGTNTIVIACLIPISGWLGDKYHPLRVIMYGVWFGLFLVVPSGLLWLFWHPSPQVVFMVSIGMAVGLTAPAAAISGLWDGPALMAAFPRERYGQFCSMAACFRAAGGIVGGVLAGGFLDIITHFVGRERAYFYIPVWSLFFCIPSSILMYLFYKSFLKYGGVKNYIPPVPVLTGAGPVMEARELTIESNIALAAE